MRLRAVPDINLNRNPLEEKRPIKTLDRVLSKAGLGSRSEARSWIGAGRVAVNGKVIRTPDHWVDLEWDKVSFDGKPLRATKKVYILLHKPTGYLTTYTDPQKRSTVYDLLENVGQYVVPVGRLDMDTSGLLMLTSDTMFAERVTNPDYKVPKTYILESSKLLSDDQLDQLRQGVELSDGPTKPAIVKRGQDCEIEITITEGRNRQVRRMIEALEAKVVTLARVAIGPIRIGDLKIGTHRMLTPAEVALLTKQKGI